VSFIEEGGAGNLGQEPQWTKTKPKDFCSPQSLPENRRHNCKVELNSTSQECGPVKT